MNINKEFTYTTRLKELDLTCSWCGKDFTKSIKSIKAVFYKRKLRGDGTDGYDPLCSVSCTGSYVVRLRYPDAGTIECKCPQCGNKFTKGKQAAKRGKRTFCSRSCSATYYNTSKGTMSTTCPVCKGFKHYQSKICHNCKVSITKKKYYTRKTIGDMRGGNNWKMWNNHIRQWARRDMAESGTAKFCVICGFDAIVHVCHRKPVASFSNDATVGQVNALDNLVYLCPNHHAMYDKGMIDI